MGTSPCFDKGSCHLVELVSNKCSVGRSAALAVYQAMNLAAHVMGIVAKIVCICLDVFTESKCFLFAFPACPPLFEVYEHIFGMTNEVYHGTVALASMCKTVGDLRA